MLTDAAATFSVTYRRDMLGRLIGVGTPADDFHFARYDYNATSDVTREILNPNAGGGANARDIVYDEAQRVVAIRDRFFTQEVSYRAGGEPKAPYVDAEVTADTFQFAGSAFESERPRDHRYDYTYDPFGRLVVAKASDPVTRQGIDAWTLSLAKVQARMSWHQTRTEGNSALPGYWRVSSATAYFARPRYGKRTYFAHYARGRSEGRVEHEFIPVASNPLSSYWGRRNISLTKLGTRVGVELITPWMGLLPDILGHTFR